MRTGLLIIGTLAIMIVSGAVAAAGTLRLLMSLGMKFHDNYEYYGQGPAVLLIPAAAIVAFVVPAVVVWRLRKNRWRISLRAMLIVVTLVAVVLGIFVWAAR